MKVQLQIDNVYEDGDEVQTTVESDVPEPPDEEGTAAYDDWAEEHIFSLTGTGKVQGDAAYFVEIVGCDRQDLIGREFEFGL